MTRSYMPCVELHETVTGSFHDKSDKTKQKNPRFQRNLRLYTCITHDYVLVTSHSDLYTWFLNLTVLSLNQNKFLSCAYVTPGPTKCMC